jgi:hypothetical protein
MDCPKCRSGVEKLPKRGYRHDFACLSCDLKFSIIGSDWPAINAGAGTSLGQPDVTGRIWLRPAYRAHLT